MRNERPSSVLVWLEEVSCNELAAEHEQKRQHLPLMSLNPHPYDHHLTYIYTQLEQLTKAIVAEASWFDLYAVSSSHSKVHIVITFVVLHKFFAFRGH